MPEYKPEAKTIKIPTKEKLEMIIASAGKVMSIKLSISKECGLRPIELCQLQVRDIDLEQKLIHSKTAKNGNPKFFASAQHQATITITLRKRRVM
jgi:integrase